MAIEPVSGSPTRSQYRAVLRGALADRTVYPDYLLDQWVSDGIREYSANFPYKVFSTILCEAGVRFYLLNDKLSLNAIMGVTAVEYPTGQEPRRFLSRLDEHSGGFLGSAVYDVNNQNDTVSFEYGTPQLHYLVLGETPSAGESIWIEYDTVHQVPTSDNSVITVPEHHLELVRLYVVWRAADYLETSEAISIDRKDVTDLRMRTARAESTYRARIKDALVQQSGRYAPVNWKMPGVKGDRVY